MSDAAKPERALAQGHVDAKGQSLPGQGTPKSSCWTCSLPLSPSDDGVLGGGRMRLLGFRASGEEKAESALRSNETDS